MRQPALAEVAMAMLPLHAAIAIPLTYKISHQEVSSTQLKIYLNRT
jgi:hypothetical protein